MKKPLRPEESMFAIDSASDAYGLPIVEMLAGIEQSSSGIIVAQAPDVAITLANAAAQKILGPINTSGGEILGSDAHRYFDADGLPIAPEDLPLARAILKGEHVHECEISVKNPDGTIRHTLGSATPIENEAGEVTSGITIFVDITDRQEAEERVARELSFQTLIARIAAQLLAAPLSEAPHAMATALRDVAAHFEASRIGCWWFDDITSASINGLHWQLPGHEPAPVHFELEDWPWLFPQISAGHVVRIPAVSKLPAVAQKEREMFQQFGISSYLGLPLSIEGKRVGGAEVSMFEGEREWSDQEVMELQFAVNILATFQVRSESERELQLQKKVYEHAQRLAQIGSLYYDMDKAKAEVSDEAANILGLETNELTLAGMSELIHPEDRAAAIGTIQQGLAAESPINHRYRLLRPDGTVTHVAEIGALIPGTRIWVATFHNITDIAEREAALEESLRQVQELQDRLQAENHHLREEAQIAKGTTDLVGQSTAIQQCLADAERVAPTDATVLILGETGTGKELFAQTVHDLSKRSNGPMITVNCAALPDSLIENELFGHERGAYTGANRAQMGCFELANDGTLFLDEVGELPLDVQGKLLRAIQEKEIHRLGSEKTIKVDVRLIAATNRDLAELVQVGKFRSDLYYRLNVFQIRLPSLSERLDDMPLLARHLLGKIAPRVGKPVADISDDGLKHLLQHDWPGNVRELENVLERAIISCTSNTLTADCFEGIPLNQGTPAASRDNTWRSLEDIDRDHIVQVLNACDWQIEGETGAAARLQLKPSTLRSRMQKLNIKRNDS